VKKAAATFLLLLLPACGEQADLERRLGRLEKELARSRRELEQAGKDLLAARQQLAAASAACRAYRSQLEDLRQLNRRLLERLEELEKKIRDAAAARLVPQFSARSVVPFLGHSNPNVRRAAAQILKHLADPEAVQPLAAVATSRADPDTRANALLALASYRDRRAAETIAALLGDAERVVRCAAYRAAAQQASPVLLEPLLEAGRRELARPAAAEGPFNEELPLLARALAAMKDIRAGRMLLGMLEHPHRQIRREAARAFTDYENPQIVPDIVAFLLRARKAAPDDYLPPQCSLLTALARLGDPRGMEPAVRCLASPNRSVRHAAAKAIRALARPEHVPLLAKLLATGKTPDGDAVEPYFLTTVAQTLGGLGDPRAAAALIACTGSGDRSLALAAGRALANCIDPACTELLIKAWRDCRNRSVKEQLHKLLSSGAWPARWVQEKATFVPADKVDDVF